MSKGENKNMGKWFKVSFFIMLLIGTGYFGSYLKFAGWDALEKNCHHYSEDWQSLN
ncbi:unnamed protein product [marine sediment metagenome]|uniref:Uncharacterized protein n=1 Tax=marine sediment metagenome TaxID=412755 RepID=X1J7Q8_9ZZZZ